jgi:hypothetical protein
VVLNYSHQLIPIPSKSMEMNHLSSASVSVIDGVGERERDELKCDTLSRSNFDGKP